MVVEFVDAQEHEASPQLLAFLVPFVGWECCKASQLPLEVGRGRRVSRLVVEAEGLVEPADPPASAPVLSCEVAQDALHLRREGWNRESVQALLVGKDGLLESLVPVPELLAPPADHLREFGVVVTAEVRE